VSESSVPPPRRVVRRRRLFAIYLITTLGGGFVLIFFVITLWLLYWMQAPARLPEPGRLIPADAVAYCVFDVRAARGLNLPDSALLVKSLAGTAPSPVRRLLEKGLREPRCPIRLVCCAVRRTGGLDTVIVASLGRFPGLFGVVRRELLRRASRGELETLGRGDRQAIFLMPDRPDLPVLGIAACSILRGSSEPLVREEARAIAGDISSANVRADLDALRKETPADCVAWAWASDWSSLALDRWLFAGGPGDDLFAIAPDLLARLSSLEDLKLWARPSRDGMLEVESSMRAPDEATGHYVAGALHGWKGTLGKAGSVSISATYDPAAGRITVAIRPR